MSTDVFTHAMESIASHKEILAMDNMVMLSLYGQKTTATFLLGGLYLPMTDTVYMSSQAKTPGFQKIDLSRFSAGVYAIVINNTSYKLVVVK